MPCVWCLVPGSYQTTRRQRPLTAPIHDRSIAENSINLILSRHLPGVPSLRTRRSDGGDEFHLSDGGIIIQGVWVGPSNVCIFRIGNCPTLYSAALDITTGILCPLSTAVGCSGRGTVSIADDDWAVWTLSSALDFVVCGADANGSREYDSGFVANPPSSPSVAIDRR